MALVGLPLLFFFIVFYNNNSYQRYFQLYSHTVGMGAAAMEWTALVKSHSPDGARFFFARRRCSRAGVVCARGRCERRL